MLKSLSLTICASLLAFAGAASAAGGKEKITCHHGPFAMFQLDMDWASGKATISERIKKQWVQTYKGARLARDEGGKGVLADATTAQATTKSKDCGVDTGLSFELGGANAKGVRVGHASRSFARSQRCSHKAPPPDLGEAMITLKCK